MWGTVGWIVASWTVGGWLALSPRPVPREELSDMFRVAAVLALGVYALTLPHTPPQHRLGSALAPLAACVSWATAPSRSTPSAAWACA
jgi:hypothetical protein